MVRNQNENDTKNFNDEITEKDKILKRLYEIYKTEFINTPFSQRFEKFISDAREEKLYGIVGAYTRNGKTWCLKDIIKNSGAAKYYSADSRIPVIAVHSSESTTDMLMSLCRACGKVPNSKTSMLKNWLIENIPRLGVQQIIIDDAHELSIKHFKFIKELIDVLELEKNYVLSLVMVSITSSNNIGVYRKIINYSTEDWMQQFFERFRYYREVEGHTEEETGSIIYTYEDLYRPILPKIKLIDYTGNIYGWLTSPEVDFNNTRRVAMEHLAKLIYHSAKIAVQHDLNSIPLDLIKHVYDVYLAGPDRLYSTENEPVYKPKNRKVCDAI